MMKHDVNKYINKNAMSVAISKKKKIWNCTNWTYQME